MRHSLLYLASISALLLASAAPSFSVERIVVSPENGGFLTEDSKKPFHPWGFNYGGGPLIEDFWNDDWAKVTKDFREMKRLGANVVRVHLQFGKFMSGPAEPLSAASARLTELLRLAEETDLYLDLTGLACYRPEDTPAWYDALDEPARWKAQAGFWEAIAKTCAGSSAILCYDLMNEPIVPGEKRGADQWRSGQLLGGYDFVQFITLDPAGRPRGDVAVDWIRQMKTAIRQHDAKTLVTVGCLPWSRQWEHLSGFVPEKIAPELDYLSVHIYPDSKKPKEAMECLQKFVAGKPIVIEETFPLQCTGAELESFLRASQKIAAGWIGHYNGDSLEELDALSLSGSLSPAQAVFRDWLHIFVRLGPDFAH
jgi:Cellulase (glycosyl hydrolase family 5)